jgi:hypothetical protein
MSDQERYDQENDLLYRHGFNLAYDAEDAEDEPVEFNAEGEVWQLGGRDSDVAEPHFFTRTEALEWIAERMDRND